LKKFIENRKVTKTIRNQHGEVVALCNESELWSPKLKSIAIPEIELKVHRYYIVRNNREFDVQVIKDSTGKKILVTNPHKLSNNLLFHLPDCY